MLLFSRVLGIAGDAAGRNSEINPSDRLRDQTEDSFCSPSAYLELFFWVWGRRSRWALAVEWKENYAEVEKDGWQECRPGGDVSG